MGTKQGFPMTESLHIVCPHCHTTNRVKTADMQNAPDCGGCHKPLFVAHSTALDEAAFAGTGGRRPRRVPDRKSAA